MMICLSSLEGEADSMTIESNGQRETTTIIIIIIIIIIMKVIIILRSKEKNSVSVYFSNYIRLLFVKAKALGTQLLLFFIDITIVFVPEQR